MLQPSGLRAGFDRGERDSRRDSGFVFFICGLFSKDVPLKTDLMKLSGRRTGTARLGGPPVFCLASPKDQPKLVGGVFGQNFWLGTFLPKMIDEVFFR